MTRETILNDSRDLVKQIYAKMSIIESCDAVAEKVKNLDVCFNDIDNEKIIILDEILKVEQLAEIRNQIVGKIYDNAIEAQSFLERLNRKPAVLNPVFEQAVKEMEEQHKEVVSVPEEPITAPELTVNKPVELTVELVRELYIEQDKTLDQVSKEVGTPRSTLYTFINKNGFRKPSKKERGLYRDNQIK